MNDILASDWIALTLPAAAAVFCLLAAAALASLVRINKGAKINRAWGLIAFGLTCLGLAGLDRALERLGLPNAAAARDEVSALGALLIMLGAVYARGIHRNLVK